MTEPLSQIPEERNHQRNFLLFIFFTHFKVRNELSPRECLESKSNSNNSLFCRENSRSVLAVDSFGSYHVG